MKITESKIDGNVKLEIEVRRIKNKQEMQNVMRKDENTNYSEKDFVIISKTVNEHSFQPEIIIALKGLDGTLTRGPFYLCNLEVVPDSGIEKLRKPVGEL